MRGGHRGRERIPRNFGPPADDELFRYEFAAPLGIELSVGLSFNQGRHNGGLIYFGGSYKHCQHDLADH